MAVGGRRGVGAARSRIVSSEEQLVLLRMRLHDSTLQTLEFIANMGAMEGADMDRLVRLAAREATELRHMLEGLTREAPVTLTTSLSEVVTAATAYGDERIELAVGPTDDSVESFTALELAAAVREALTNARKHAGASAITVYVEEHDGDALVTVKDDGRGADLATLRPRLGIGVSMKTRMARLGGDVEFQSQLGEGFLVRLTLHPPAPAVQAPPTGARERRRHDGRQHAQRSAVR